MILNWLESYNPKTDDDFVAALREIMQEVALVGLYRAGFFKEAAFYGGTCLRVFYGLPRFSEDLDFSLLYKNASFKIANYLSDMIAEFEAVGMKVQVSEKPKKIDSQIESAFLKSETEWKELVLNDLSIPSIGKIPTIKIKLEVDTLPPLSFQTENKLLLRPYSFYVNCFKIEDLFAGKMHALLFRKWKNRVKGRDWFDLEWYIRRGTKINLRHFSVRAMESGDLTEGISKEGLIQLLETKIEALNISQVKADIERFIPAPSVLDIWSKDYFLQVIQKIQVQ